VRAKRHFTSEQPTCYAPLSTIRVPFGQIIAFTS